MISTNVGMLKKNEAMMTREEIERAIAAGAEKRAARRAKRQAAMLEAEKNSKAKERVCVLAGFRERLEKAWQEMERAHSMRTEISSELKDEVKSLFLPNAEDDFRFELYQMFFHDYEALIFYAWIVNDELCEASFNFWDGVLSHPDVLVSGNSILRICSKPNQKLLKIIKNHKDVLLDEAPFRIAMKNIVERHLLEPGLYNFETKSFDLWTDEEREILEEIKELF